MTEKHKDILSQLIAFLSALGLALGVFLNMDLDGYIEVIIAVVTAGFPLVITFYGIWRNHFATGQKAFAKAELKKQRQRKEEFLKGAK